MLRTSGDDAGRTSQAGKLLGSASRDGRTSQAGKLLGSASRDLAKVEKSSCRRATYIGFETFVNSPHLPVRTHAEELAPGPSPKSARKDARTQFALPPRATLSPPLLALRKPSAHHQMAKRRNSPPIHSPLLPPHTTLRRASPESPAPRTPPIPPPAPPASLCLPS
mgnify:FL=1